VEPQPREPDRATDPRRVGGRKRSAYANPMSSKLGVNDASTFQELVGLAIRFFRPRYLKSIHIL
jgi:hypothetical protein